MIIGFARVIQCTLKPGLDQSERGSIIILLGLSILDSFLRRGMKMSCHGIMPRPWLSIPIGSVFQIFVPCNFLIIGLGILKLVETHIATGCLP